MTKIIVTPIDMSAPGSHAARKRALRTYAELQEAQSGNNLRALNDALDAVEALIAEHAETDDGTTLQDAFAGASADDFDALVFAIIGGETVPNAKSTS